MNLFIFKILCGLLLTFCPRSNSQRRIVNGNPTVADKRYMVYLIKGEHSDKYYDNWICGGVIVHKSFILTSAACVEDVTYMYAIAGYNKYVNPSSVAGHHDECILKTRKRIIFSCLPKRIEDARFIVMQLHAKRVLRRKEGSEQKSLQDIIKVIKESEPNTLPILVARNLSKLSEDYNFSYERIEDWAHIDIAIVKVESPYNFKTPISSACSWIPNAIIISYDSNHMKPGRNAMVLGWGSKRKWRQRSDKHDYNQENLQYSTVQIQSKSECMKYYAKLPMILNTIDKYMICTMGSGNIDDQGHEIVRMKPSSDGCQEPGPCHDDVNHIQNFPFTPYRKNSEKFKYNNSSNSTSSEDPLFATYGYNLPLHEIYNGSVQDHVRRQLDLVSTGSNGICQNDHGGPLITWVGAKETLIGTASMYLIRNGSCVGPYLFTSTTCNGVFISCVLTKFIDESELEDLSHEIRRFNTPMWFDYDICDLPPEEVGFEIVQRRIRWPDTVDKDISPGAEDEPVEDLIERSQVPIREFN